MSIVSTTNIKFLFALLAWIAIATGTTDAAAVRGNRSARNEERQLKKSKSGGGPVQPIQPIQPTTVVADTTSVVVTGPSTGIAARITTFEVGCGNQAQSLENCAQSGGLDPFICKQCILGLSTLNSVTMSGLNSCSDAAFGEYCTGCLDQVTAYYNCGAGANLGVTASVTAVTTSGGVTVGGFAPTTFCQVNTPAAGDSCTVPTPFNFIECYFVGFKCTCRSDENLWACFIHP